MTLTLPNMRLLPWLIAALFVMAGVALFAQMEGERGIPPIASSGDFEVRDIRVDVAAPDADTARASGWRLAQRLAWQSLWARTHGGARSSLPDGVLDSIVSGIEVESEQIGPNRYIATLSVLFDRARAGQILGVSGQMMRSPPLLVIPVLREGGASAVFEYQTDWQRAWANFRTADSAIDYVRTSGSNADAILLNAGQINRRGRNWWRNLLDQYGAADVIMPIARIERSYPGGPVKGRFIARYGPDNQYIGEFTLRANGPDGVARMMQDAVKRIDQLYVDALVRGILRPDPSLVIEETVDPELLNAADAVSGADLLPVETTGAVSTGASTVMVQFDTPTVASVSQGESAMRGVPGVRSVSTTSLALGGISVMQVGFDGPPDTLKAALQARGFTVAGSGNSLRISRRATSAPSVEAPQ